MPATRKRGANKGMAHANFATSHWIAHTRTCAVHATTSNAGIGLQNARTVANSSQRRQKACARLAMQSTELTIASAYVARTDVQSKPEAYACHATTSTGMNTNDTID